MIVKETILREIFSQLPDYVDSNEKSFPIRYEWGSEADLNLFLTTISGNKYPLIWLEHGKQTDSRSGHYSDARLRIFIAKNSNHKENRNPTVWDTEFVECLNPLLEKVIECLERSGVTTIINNENMDIDRRANYTEINDEKTKTIDHWNVIVLDVTVRFEEKANGQPKCINPQIFK